MNDLPTLTEDFPVFVRPNIVDRQTCAELVKFTEEELGDEPVDGIVALKYERVNHLRSPTHAHVKRLMNAFRYTAIHQVRGHFDGVGRILPSTTLLTLWHPGRGLAPHCDTDTWWRTFTSICYLNDDFAGGELEFVRSGHVVRPEPGLFVAFRSDDRRTHHLVTPVEGGCRFTISAFLTNQVERTEL